MEEGRFQGFWEGYTQSKAFILSGTGNFQQVKLKKKSIAFQVIVSEGQFAEA